jgi:hypothetical protein
MAALTVVLALLALVGHAALWVGFVNRVHSTGAPRPVIKLFSGCGHALLVLLPLIAVWFWWNSGISFIDWMPQAAQCQALWFYFVLCWIMALLTVALWIPRHLLPAKVHAVLSSRTTMADIAAVLGHKPAVGWRARLLSLVPGNQIFQLAIDEKQLALPRLPAPLDGFSIAHLSDLHFTGRIGIDFFKAVVERTNALRADLIVLTGDVLDEMELVDWIPQTIARLSAPLGVYFVLGNHDQFTGEGPRLRQALTAAGLMDLGGRWKRLDVNGAEIILAGNELPWFAPSPDMRQCPARSADHPQLRLLLSHSPDQFPWARRCDFDLMLAGHTHGGQIRLPLIGPIFSPSSHGVKYASGTFYASPTLMHVSRGISSELPLRFNCRPELTKIVLRSSAS